MKNLYFTVILTVILFSGCTAASKTLVETGGEASCVDYEVHDESGNVTELPSHINESLFCATGAVQLSPNGKYLLYDHDDSLRFYDFEENKDNSLFGLRDELEGISCLWHDSNEKIACALVNQQKYEGGTKYLVIDLHKGVKQYEITQETMADFVCGASCYPGEFWFEDENTLKYEGHNIVASGEVFEINLN